MKVVVDTNVYLAGFATRGISSGVVEICIQNHELIICTELLEEVRRNLSKKFKVPQARIEEIAGFLENAADMVVPFDLPADSCRDPNDVFLLGLAEASDADCIVTGDKDLLDMKWWKQIPIHSPRQFYDLIRQNPE